VNWTNNTNINQSSQFEPSLTVFNNRLYVSFIANNSGNEVLVCSSADGTNWTNNTDIGQSSKFGPSLAVSSHTNWPVPTAFGGTIRTIFSITTAIRSQGYL
jgi:hypothetical protein